eukprot:COSAG04_NODE_1337_length_7164_cov_5.346780_5_plen_346_part_00
MVRVVGPCLAGLGQQHIAPRHQRRGRPAVSAHEHGGVGVACGDVGDGREDSGGRDLGLSVLCKEPCDRRGDRGLHEVVERRGHDAPERSCLTLLVEHERRPAPRASPESGAGPRAVGCGLPAAGEALQPSLAVHDPRGEGGAGGGGILAGGGAALLAARRDRIGEPLLKDAAQRRGAHGMVRVLGGAADNRAAGSGQRGAAGYTLGGPGGYTHQPLMGIPGWMGGGGRTGRAARSRRGRRCPSSRRRTSSSPPPPRTRRTSAAAQRSTGVSPAAAGRRPGRQPAAAGGIGAKGCVRTSVPLVFVGLPSSVRHESALVQVDSYVLPPTVIAVGPDASQSAPSTWSE